MSVPDGSSDEVSTRHLILAFSSDDLRGTVWDSHLEIIAEVVVDFVEISGRDVIVIEEDRIGTWLSAIDTLLDRLSSNFPLHTINSISGTVPTPTHIIIPPTFHNALNSLTSAEPLTQLFPYVEYTTSTPPLPRDQPANLVTSEQAFYPHHIVSPNIFDTSTTPSLHSIRHSLPFNHPYQTRSIPLNSTPLHLLKLLQQSPNFSKEIGEGAKIVSISYLLAALLTQTENSSAVTPQERVLCSGGLWSEECGWDDDILRVLGGGGGSGKGMDGIRRALDVGENAAPGDIIGRLGKYWEERWGFENVSILPFLPSVLAGHTSTLPSTTEMTISMGEIDHLILPLTHKILVPYAKALGGIVTRPLLPMRGSHNLHGDEIENNLVAIFEDVNAGAARLMMRDTYGNGKWTVFGQIAMLIPPGGSNGVDDKLFSFIWPREVQTSYGSMDGLVRYESGIRTKEFRDLRANPRCVLESQFLAMRLYERELQDPLSPYKRIIVLGRPGSNPAIPHLLSGVFNLPVHIPTTARGEQTNRSRQSSLGAAMIAIYSLHQSRNRTSGLEDDFGKFIFPLLQARDSCGAGITTPEGKMRDSFNECGQSIKTPPPIFASPTSSFSPNSRVSRTVSTTRLEILREEEEEEVEEVKSSSVRNHLGHDDTQRQAHHVDDTEWSCLITRPNVNDNGMFDQGNERPPFTPPCSPPLADNSLGGSTSTSRSSASFGVSASTGVTSADSSLDNMDISGERTGVKKAGDENWLVRVAGSNEGWTHDLYGTMLMEYSRLRNLFIKGIM